MLGCVWSWMLIDPFVEDIWAFYDWVPGISGGSSGGSRGGTTCGVHLRPYQGGWMTVRRRGRAISLANRRKEIVQISGALQLPVVVRDAETKRDQGPEGTVKLCGCNMAVLDMPSSTNDVSLPSGDESHPVNVSVVLLTADVTGPRGKRARARER
ncbi:hypothetical protein Dimus_001643 [Dionaea muscipula]